MVIQISVIAILGKSICFFLISFPQMNVFTHLQKK